MRTRTLASTALLTLATLCGSLQADIGPKPSTNGSCPGPMTDMPGINVEMTSEKVGLVLSRAKGWSDHLTVTADFNMTNLGEKSTTFEVGFPVGAIHNMDAFSIEIDGKRIKHRLIDRTGGKVTELTDDEARKRHRVQRRFRKSQDLWYVWKATFPKGASRHLVKYRISISGHRPRRFGSTSWAGYILRTGAPWKNKIGKAVVTLRCTGGMTLDNIRKVEPMAGLVRDKDKLVWTFNQLEPTKSHDIDITYHRLDTWQSACAELRKKADKFWNARANLADLLASSAARFGKPKYSAEQRTELLTTLDSLVSEAKVQGDKLVLPRWQPNTTSYPKNMPAAMVARLRKESGPSHRGYVGRNGFTWFTKPLTAALAMSELDPNDARAKRVLVKYVRLAEALLAGKLYAESEQIDLYSKTRLAKVRKELAKARKIVKP